MNDSRNYTGAVRNLARDTRFPPDLVQQLERLSAFRNVLIHEYVALDLDRVVEALAEPEPIERFAQVIRDILDEEDRDSLRRQLR